MQRLHALGLAFSITLQQDLGPDDLQTVLSEAIGAALEARGIFLPDPPPSRIQTHDLFDEKWVILHAKGTGRFSLVPHPTLSSNTLSVDMLSTIARKLPYPSSEFKDCALLFIGASFSEFTSEILFRASFLAPRFGSLSARLTQGVTGTLEAAAPASVLPISNADNLEQPHPCFVARALHGLAFKHMDPLVEDSCIASCPGFSLPPPFVVGNNSARGPSRKRRGSGSSRVCF